MWGKRNDMVVHRSEPYNAEPSRLALASDYVTPIDTFYVRNHGAVPSLDPMAWRICVTGLVRSPVELDLEQLNGSFQTRTLNATLQCAGNRRAALAQLHPIPGEDPWGPCATSTGRWTGVRLADVLRAACLDEQATEHVEFIAADESDTAVPPQPYGSSIPLRKALSGEVLLAWQLNGEDLPAVHGGPVRVVVPGYIGARSVKWVQRLTALGRPSSNYYQETAYRLLPSGGTPGPGAGVSLGPVSLNSDILQPADGASVPAGDVEVRGYAHSGDGLGSPTSRSPWTMDTRGCKPTSTTTWDRGLGACGAPVCTFRRGSSRSASAHGTPREPLSRSRRKRCGMRTATRILPGAASPSPPRLTSCGVSGRWPPVVRRTGTCAPHSIRHPWPRQQVGSTSGPKRGTADTQGRALLPSGSKPSARWMRVFRCAKRHAGRRCRRDSSGIARVLRTHG